MGSLAGLLFVYVVGGVTFIPLLLALLFLHAYLTLPPSSTSSSIQSPQEAEGNQTPDNKQTNHQVHRNELRRQTDDTYSLKSGTDVLAEKFHRAHEGDVAAGYFAVCREYVPGGVNGKPPERATPAGDVVVTAESPSVYQAMYRSIFDRKQVPTIEPNKGGGNGKNVKRARNMFYVVLRHGHLMLYDDAEQLEVRYVISLALHDVTIYGAEPDIPEGELWIKRNAICLTRKSTTSGPDSQSPSTPSFYLFSDNLSEKEDFYFAILNNLEKGPNFLDNPPAPEHFNVDHMVNLVRRLHSSEEHLQTRWINALIGRLFLALYKTEQLEDALWTKISKKISRAKKPNFITQVALQRIEAGEGAPFITNPRLKDLTVDGDCCVEADIDYSGNFLMQVAATARIDLGARFKPREVDLVLAVVLKKLKGHMLFRIKPPPSNRIWISFETMPTMEMALEPIVSTRQITYGIILRAIESRIREVVAETLVQPFWDDIPFFDTELQKYRGGIWHRETPRRHRTTVIPDETGESQTAPAPIRADFVTNPTQKSQEDLPTPPGTSSGLDQSPTTAQGEGGEAASALADTPSFSSGFGRIIARPDPAMTVRARSIPNIADPVLTAQPLNVPSVDTKHQHAPDATSQILKSLSSARSPHSSPGTTTDNLAQGASFMRPSSSGQPMPSASSISSATSNKKPRSRTLSTSSRLSSSMPATPTEANISHHNFNIDGAAAVQNFIGPTPDLKKTPSIGSNKSSNLVETRQVVTAFSSAAAAAAKKWGLNVFGRAGGGDQSPTGAGPRTPTDRSLSLDQPMGRGRPLPPPGTPLPPPDDSIFRSSSSLKSITMPKRKPVPPPLLPERSSSPSSPEPVMSRPVPKPPLPKRKSVSKNMNVTVSDDVLVIQAPDSSEPSSPVPGEIPPDIEVAQHPVDNPFSIPVDAAGDSQELNDESRMEPEGSVSSQRPSYSDPNDDASIRKKLV